MHTISKKNLKYVEFPNIGYVLDKVPSRLFESLKEEVEYIKTSTDNISVNHTLAGHLKQEYLIIKNKLGLSYYITQLSSSYLKNFGLENEELLLGDCWVNLQEKHEFNPVHGHDGDLSFVIWLDIPYSFEEEYSLFSPRGESQNGQFQFVYTNVLGRISSQHVEATAGTICLFPARLSHVVYPFYTSDKYRISISGNLYGKSDAIRNTL